MLSRYWIIAVLSTLAIVPLVPAQGAVILAPQSDAYVLRQDPNANFGLDPELLVKNAAPAPPSGDFDRKAYLRFDTSPLGGLVAQGSVLSLHVIAGIGELGNITGQSIQFSVFALNDGDAGESWGEAGITWNNAPGNDTRSGDGLLSNTTLLGSVSLIGTAVGEEVRFSSAALDAFVNQDTDDRITLIVVRNFFDPAGNGYYHAFGSREAEAALRPSLSVTAVPEPSGLVSAALGLAGLAGYAGWRRVGPAKPERGILQGR